MKYRIRDIVQYRYKYGAPTGIRKAASDTDCNWWLFKDGVTLSGAPRSIFPKIAYALDTIRYIITYYKFKAELKK